MEWHAVARRLMKHGEQFALDNTSMINVLLVCIVMGPMRWLAKWLFSRSKLVQGPRRMPPMCDLVAPAF